MNKVQEQIGHLVTDVLLHRVTERLVRLLSEDDSFMTALKEDLTDSFIARGAAIERKGLGQINDPELLRILSSTWGSDDFSSRTRNVLHNMRIETITDLVICTKERLQKQRNAGKSTIRDIENFLALFNLKMGQMDFSTWEKPTVWKGQKYV